jgi:hypothetical protein
MIVCPKVAFFPLLRIVSNNFDSACPYNVAHFEGYFVERRFAATILVVILLLLVSRGFW